MRRSRIRQARRLGSRRSRRDRTSFLAASKAKASGVRSAPSARATDCSSAGGRRRCIPAPRPGRPSPRTSPRGARLASCDLIATVIGRAAPPSGSGLDERLRLLPRLRSTGSGRGRKATSSARLPEAATSWLAVVVLGRPGDRLRGGRASVFRHTAPGHAARRPRRLSRFRAPPGGRCCGHATCLRASPPSTRRVSRRWIFHAVAEALVDGVTWRVVDATLLAPRYLPRSASRPGGTPQTRPS